MTQHIAPLLALAAFAACSSGKDPEDASPVADDSGGGEGGDDTGVADGTEGGGTEGGGVEGGGEEGGGTEGGGTEGGGEGGGTDDTGEPTAIPVSSRCIVATEDIGACTHGVYAEDWTGDVRYEWVVTDGYNHSTLTATEGGVETTVVAIETSYVWHMTGGLAVMPDGDLVLGGITLPNSTLTIGSTSEDLGTDYVRFIARVSPAGELRWVKTIVGVTGESIVISPRTDDSALVSGTIYQDTTIGADVVVTDFFWDQTFLAAIDADGDWLWATGATKPSTGYTRAYFDDMRGELDGGAQVDLTYLSSTDVSLGSFTCAAGVTCTAMGTVSEDGEWVEIEPR